MMRRAQPWLGTLVDITMLDQGNASSRAFDSAFDAIALVHRLMSFHAAGSDVSRINRARPGDDLMVHHHTYAVLQLADTVHRATQGVFNIDCGARLVDWGYLPAPADYQPVASAQSSAVELLQPGWIRKTNDGWIDLGGIAKGYAVDVASEVLLDAGAVAACVNAGGDLRVIGEQDVPILVRSPDNAQPVQYFTLRHGALATSGTYFSRRYHGDDMVSALVHGQTGRPMSALFSASVLAERCAVADALTKVILATGNASHPVLSQFQATGFIV